MQYNKRVLFVSACRWQLELTRAIKMSLINHHRQTQLVIDAVVTFLMTAGGLQVTYIRIKEPSSFQMT